ncbi:MAG TPA: hypothetical protein VK879_18515, partial [Candidatus Sulfomarinibacteraceae bacterium]|nr:hypothetical protein [Candidatus Sulfomarinibacteraceae bacterium]
MQRRNWFYPSIILLALVGVTALLAGAARAGQDGQGWAGYLPVVLVPEATPTATPTNTPTNTPVAT